MAAAGACSNSTTGCSASEPFRRHGLRSTDWIERREVGCAILSAPRLNQKFVLDCPALHLLQLPRHFQQLRIVRLRNGPFGSVDEQRAAIDLAGHARKIGKRDEAENPNDPRYCNDPEVIQR